jgi:hypothetical protein
VIARVLALLLASLPLLAGAAAAQTPGADALTPARQLSTLLTGDNFELVLNQVMKAIVPLAKAAIERDAPRPLTQAEETAIATAFRRSFETVYPRTMWEEETAQILASHLDAAELTEALQFYRSPVGQKMLGLNIALMTAGERMFKSRESQLRQHLLGELQRELGRGPR